MFPQQEKPDGIENTTISLAAMALHFEVHHL